jgi:branched-subunit amino acid aminotransferase/4-amino-4-deoxychorismate lyase
MNPDPAYLPFALFNGTVLATDAVRISPLGSGFMAGEGLFETLRVHQSRPLFPDAHLARLTAALNSLGAALPLAPAGFRDRCRQTIAANSLVHGSLKVIVFRESTHWSELILARPSAYTAAHYAAGFRLKTVPTDLRVDPLHALKSLNYLPNLHAKRVARAAGCDEALFTDPHRHLLEGATTSVFVVKDGRVSTPRLQSLILPGVMRAVVLQLLPSATVRERLIALDELPDADEVFVTNALLGVMPVAQVDATAYPLDRNPVTRSLMSALADRIAALPA